MGRELLEQRLLVRSLRGLPEESSSGTKRTKGEEDQRQRAQDQGASVGHPLLKQLNTTAEITEESY